MALTLNCNTGASGLLLAPNSNGMYSNCVVSIGGNLSTNTPGGETIDSITVDQGTITIDNITFNGSPVSFPYTVDPLNATIFGFDIYPTDTPGNADQFKFTFNMAVPGAYAFTYNMTELDIQSSITVANNTLPLDFGVVEVGSSSLPVSFVINNETCYRYNYSWYSDNGDIVFDGSSASLFPRTTYTEGATWTPTSAYDLAVYKIFCDTDSCGNGIYDVAGTSFEPPPPVIGVSSKKLVIANSISI